MKDKKAASDKDKDLDRLLSRFAGQSPSAIDHPGANLLSAFVEQRLMPSERETVLSHMAACADCRTIAHLASPEPELQQAVVKPYPAAIAWNPFRWVSAAAMLAVVIAGVALHYRNVDDPQVAQLSPATAPAAASSADAQREAEPSVSAKQTAPESSKMRSQVSAKTNAVPTEGPNRNLRAANNARPDAASNLSFDGAPAAQAFAPSRTGSDASSARMKAASAPRWNLSSDGTIERSLDAGKTWNEVAIAANTEFKAIAAHGNEVWVGGAQGALYRSENAGETWEPVKPLVATNSLTADVTKIELADDNAIHVTAGDRVWTSQDAGSTWSMR